MDAINTGDEHLDVSNETARAICHALTDEELTFLGRFVRLEDVKQILRLNRWTGIPRPTIDDYLQRLIRQGLLLPADLPQRIDYKFKVTDLKVMLRERQRPTSGRKQALIERLIESDPENLGSHVAEVEVYLCTDLGQAVVALHSAEEADKRLRFEQAVMDALRARAFNTATNLVYDGGIKAVMSVSFGGTSSDDHYRERDTSVLEAIFNNVPTVLKGLTEPVLDVLRVAAGMLNLFSNGPLLVSLFPSDFTTGLQVENLWAARLLITHVFYHINLKELRKRHVEQVQIRGVNDSYVCVGCRDIQSRVFKIGSAPELPNAKCTSPLGCRCSLHPVLP